MFLIKKNTILVLKLIISIYLTGNYSYLSADEYTKGYESYTNGNYSQCEKIFSNIINLQSTNEEKSDVYKMIGICQYMLGKRDNAQETFKQAINHNYQTTIVADEVLDENILDFFQSIKNTLVDTSKETTEENPTHAEDENGFLTLIINDNIPAEIIINGKDVIPANKGILLKSGVYNILVSAPGYQNKNFPVEIQKNKNSRINIQLSKIIAQTEKKNLIKETKEKSKKKKEKKVDQTLKKKTRKVTEKKSNRKVQLIEKNWSMYDLAPFGVPQFLDNKPDLGKIFIASQTLAMSIGSYYYYKSYTTAKNSSSTIDRMSEDMSTTQSEIDQYESDQKTLTSDYYRSSLIYFSLFLGSWAISSIEAIVNKPRKKVSILFDSNDKIYGYPNRYAKNHTPSWSVRNKIQYSLRLLPTLKKEKDFFQHEFILDFNLKL